MIIHTRIDNGVTEETSVYRDVCSRWYTIYTKPRHEKFAESGLIQKGFDAFTPKAIFRRRWSDRIKLVEEPLFKSYCFARFDLRDRFYVLGQRGVVALVHFNQQYIPVDDSVIESLKILAFNHTPIDPHPYVKTGDKVVILRGPLKGVEGFVVEKRAKAATIVVSVDVITSSVSCVVDSDCVEVA